jgi:DNA invertase Pin-like site-specific DNA recombinase
MNARTVGNYYRQHLKHNKIEVPVSKKGKRYTKDEKAKFIRDIVDGKMTPRKASFNANMSTATGQKKLRKIFRGPAY